MWRVVWLVEQGQSRWDHLERAWMRHDEGDEPKLEDRKRDGELVRKENQQKTVLWKKDKREDSVKSWAAPVSITRTWVDCSAERYSIELGASFLYLCPHNWHVVHEILYQKLVVGLGLQGWILYWLMETRNSLSIRLGNWPGKLEIRVCNVVMVRENMRADIE